MKIKMLSVNKYYLIFTVVISMALCMIPTCKGTGSGNGELVATDLSTQLTSDPPPVITVTNQSPTSFPVTFSNKSSSNFVLPFNIGNVNFGETYTFDISQRDTLDFITSFPIVVGQTPLIQLAAVPLGTIAQIQSNAISSGLISGQGSGSGMILGIINLNGTGCSPLQSVVVLGSAGLPIGQGPYFFNNEGNIVATGTFGDIECTYVFFNVTQGNHTLQFSGSGVTKEVPVFVQAGRVSVGINTPLLF